MEKYYVLVAGNGATSRQNVEALMEDHYYINGDNGIVVIPVGKAPTQTQIFVAQYAKDRNKEIVLVAPEEANLSGVPSASVVPSKSPISKAIEIVAGEKTTGFLLWDDADEACLEALALCKKANIKCLDLTNGLAEISPAEDIKRPEKITFPEAEQVTESEDNDGEEEEDSEEEEDDEYEEDEEEAEDSEDIYAGVEALARIFARVLVEEWKKAVNEDKS